MQHAPAQIRLAVDSVIFGFDERELKLLLIQRDIEPQGAWSLVGGFVEANEDLDAAAVRILRKYTGLDNIFIEQLHTFGNVNRDPTGRVISVVYYALLKISLYDEKLSKAYNVQWVSIHKLPPLIYDHRQMVQVALDHLKEKVSTHPVGFELLQEQFTLPQLQSLYEVILDRKLDRRNFRKKMLSTNLLIKLEKAQRDFANRPADYYRFDRHKYQELARNGFSFAI